MNSKAIIVFDAQCVLCSANAQFVLRFDRRHHFRLAALQSSVGQDLYRQFGIDPSNPDTLIVVSEGQAKRDSDAIIEIWSQLGWPWQVLTAARFIPRGLRDPAYRWIARHRYSLFGKRQTCWVPRPEDADRLL